MRAFFALTVILAALAACQTTQDPVERIGSTIHGTWHDARPHGVRSLNIVELPQSIRQEHQDRANRLDRLSRQFGAPMPVVTDTFQVDPGAIPGVAHAVPVIQVRYPEKTFFDFDSTKIRPEATPILDVLAEAMMRDLPDTGLMVVGHTDSIGSEAYNTDLSLRRAAAVMVELANRGVRIEQMETAGVGEMQPIATNMTDDGRALNRRVEFTLSRYPRANAMVLASVGTRLDLMPNPRDGISAAGGG
ncbi:MAG TPA: OmpA family protein, partial [Arenibaculum sp.]|nr:OmpA family protein [Arenibaculum sp.]